MLTRRGLAALLVLAAGQAAGSAAAQEAWPTRPIRMLVPFPPGGSIDILARAVAPRMIEGLKQNVLIENRPGANGNIATEQVARSQPDGYTLLFTQVSNLCVNPAIYADIPFDTLKDLAPIALIASTPQVMVVAAGSPFKSMADVTAAVKAKPGDVSFASSGNGSMAHMAIELMQLSAGIKFLHVPYKGAAPAVVDVVAGRADVYMAAMPTVMGQVRAGKLRAIAVASGQRVADLPGVPTLSESGFPGFESGNWFAITGRAGTPRAIIDRLNSEVNKALQADDVKARIAAEGGTTLGGTPERLGELMAADLAKWRRVVKDAGVKIE